MNTLTLPVCRHRGAQFTPGHWICTSPRLVIPGGIVTAEVCRHECPYADHDDDLPPGCLPSGGGAAHAELSVHTSVAADPASVAVAMITAPRPVRTVERSLHELRRAGFEQTIYVFEEPGADLALQAGVRLFSNAERLGPWPNWRRAAASLLELSDAPFLLLCEDDICLRPDAALGLLYAVQTLPRDDWGYVSLYTPWHNLGAQPLVAGWQALSVGADSWGALAYCFTRESLQALLAYLAPLDGCADAPTDSLVSAALEQMGRTCYFHVPSLGDHTGESISSLGHRHLPEMAAVGFQPNLREYVRDPAWRGGSRQRPEGITRGADATPLAGAIDHAGSIAVTGKSVAVIVPTYNCAAYLGECVRSLRRQTVPCEIVIVDDGSRDATAAVLAKLGGGVRVLRHETSQGADAARHTGLRATDSEWVVLADADAVYAPHFLETLLSRADDEVSLVYGPYEERDVVTGAVTRSAAKPWNPETLWWSNYISMCSLVRRQALPASLTESEGLDDWSLWLNLAACGGRGRHVGEVLFTAFRRREGKTYHLRDNPHLLYTQIASERRRYASLIGVVEPIVVVIPARGCLDLTLRCLEHLSWYAGLPVEVVYVDNGSSAHVPAAVEAAAARLELPITVIRNTTNVQFTQAVNQGIRRADGRHVLVLNNDCFLGPDCLERLYWHLTRGPHRVAAVGPLTGDDYNQSLRLAINRVRTGIAPDRPLDYDDVFAGAEAVRGPFRCIDTPMLAFFCTLFHREALRDCGPLDETTSAFAAGLGADDEWCWRVARRGFALKLALDAYAVHLGGQSFRRLGIDRSTLSQAALEELERMCREDRLPPGALGQRPDRPAVGSEDGLAVAAERRRLPQPRECARADLDPFDGRSPIRNLLYYIMPVAGNGVWQRCVGALVRHMNLFNGKRVVAIVTPGRPLPNYEGPTKPDGERTHLALDDTRHVRALLAGHGCEFVETPNDPRRWETAAFEALFSRVETTDPAQVTLYAHAKGVTRPADSHLHQWVDMLYETMLDYWPLVEARLRECPVAGSFLRRCRPWPESISDWHFSGSWCWFRNAALFGQPDWRRIDQFWSGIESYFSLHFPYERAGEVFYRIEGDGAAMYDPAYARRVAAELERWRREHAAERKEW